MLSYLLPEKFFDLEPLPKPHLWGDLKIWTTEQALHPVSYTIEGKEYKSIYAYLGVQIGDQFMSVFLSFRNEEDSNQEDLIKKATAVFNQIEINGVGFQFSSRANGKWEVQQKKPFRTTTRSVDEINKAVEDQILKVSMGPSIEIFREEDIADKGPFYSYGVPQDALSMKIPTDAFSLYALSQPVHS